MRKRNERKMNTVLDEVKHFRSTSDFYIDYRNNNRYRLLVNGGGDQTAYCFNTPIYNVDTGRLVSLNFCTIKDGDSFHGSNSSITVCDNRCVLENHEGKVTVILESTTVASDFLFMPVRSNGGKCE